MKSFDEDLVQTFETLEKDPAVQTALKAVVDRMPDIIEVQKALTLIEAPTRHEEKKARRYAELLREAGLEDVTVDEHFNVFGRIPGSGRTGAAVLLEGHLDTVFSFGDVKGITVDDEGRIHAPGICDDTRALAANLNVLLALKTAGLVPVHDIIIAGTVCEEGLGGMDGMRWLLESLTQKTRILASVSIDGPSADAFYANATGMTDWDISFSGPGGHAWLRQGTPSAVHAACRAATAAADLPLSDDPKTTMTVSLIEGGHAIHGIAENASFKINARSNSQAALDRLNGEILRICREATDIENARSPLGTLTMKAEKILDIPAGTQADDARIIQAVRIATRLSGAEPDFRRGGCTNANMAIALRIPAVTLGRGGEEFGTHTLGEWFNPKGVHVCEQKSIRLILALAGLTGITEPLADTL